VQGELVPKPPVAVPDTVNVTVPAGVETVPALVAGSSTVTVQTEPWATITVEGVHETDVAVGRRFTTTLVRALLLEWLASPGKVALTLAVPAAEGANVEVQLADPTVVPTWARAHAVNVPVTVEARVTDPVGVVGPAFGSLTFAVQVEPWLTMTGVPHNTDVVVE
jgi:hypothetical protein